MAPALLCTFVVYRIVAGDSDSDSCGAIVPMSGPEIDIPVVAQTAALQESDIVDRVRSKYGFDHLKSLSNTGVYISVKLSDADDANFRSLNDTLRAPVELSARLQSELNPSADRLMSLYDV